MNISSDAQRVLQGASPEAIKYVTQNAPGQVVTSGEAERLLSKFNVVPQNVLASGNVQQTLATPTPRPDDLLGIRSQIMGEVGVGTRQAELDAAQKAYETAYGQLGQFDTATEELNRKIGEQALSTNVLRGEQATASNLRATERSGVARAAELAATTVEGKRAAVQAAKAEAETQFGIRQQEVQEKRDLIRQYPGAGITFGDSFDSAMGKISKQVTTQKDDSRKQMLQDKLLELGQKSSGSLKDLEKRLKKVNKTAYDQALKEVDQKNQLFDLQVQQTRAQIGQIGKSSGSGSYDDKDIQSYIDAYGKGQITAPNIPVKIRDQVLAGAAPILKENATLQATSDINELMNPQDKSGNPIASPPRESVISKARALYPELNQDDIIGIVNGITNSQPQQSIAAWYNPLTWF
jgi:hypothetical protein